MIQEIINFLNTYIKAHGCTEMNKWVEFLEQFGWHKGDEIPHLNNEGKSKYYLALLDGYDEYHPAKVAYNKDRWVISLDEFPDYPVNVIWWIEMPEKTEEMIQFSK